MKRNIIKHFTTLMSMAIRIFTSDQTKSDIPFGLVYQNAITENRSGNEQTERVLRHESA